MILKGLFISIIIINYNGIKHLKECFDSIKSMNFKKFELILVDNNSIDNSVKFVKENYKDVIIVQLEKNYGFAIANNIGASHAKGEYIAFLNNDTKVDKDWLIELVNLAKTSEEIGIVASKIFYYNNKEMINYAGGNIDKYGKSYHIADNKRDQQLINIPRKTFYACGAAFMISRDLYNKIGLFDPLYFIYAEDVDLCWRAWIFGYKVVFAPKSIIYHKIGQVMNKQTKRQKFLAEKNITRTILKNYEKKTLCKVLPIYFGKRFGIILKSLFGFKKLAIFYMHIFIKSFFWNIYHVRSLIKIRTKIQQNRTRNDKFLFKLMNNLSHFNKYLNKK